MYRQNKPELSFFSLCNPLLICDLCKYTCVGVVLYFFFGFAGKALLLKFGNGEHHHERVAHAFVESEFWTLDSAFWISGALGLLTLFIAASLLQIFFFGCGWCVHKSCGHCYDHRWYRCGCCPWTRWFRRRDVRTRLGIDSNSDSDSDSSASSYSSSYDSGIDPELGSRPRHETPPPLLAPNHFVPHMMHPITAETSVPLASQGMISSDQRPRAQIRVLGM